MSRKKSLEALGEKKIIDALIQSRGCVTRAAQIVGVHRRTVTRWLTAHPKLREIVEDSRDQLIDTAEHNLFEAAEKGDLAACRFILTTLGKARGYSTRKEIEQPRVRTLEDLSSNELLAFRQERLRSGEEIENDLDGQELAVLHEMSN